MTQIFLDDGRHRLAQSGGEILYSHGLLLSRVGQQSNQAGGQIFGAPGPIELNRQFLYVGHLAEVGKIRADDGYAVSAGQMRDAAATGGRRIRHHGDRGTLK